MWEPICQEHYSNVTQTSQVEGNVELLVGDNVGQLVGDNVERLYSSHYVSLTADIWSKNDGIFWN